MTNKIDTQDLLIRTQPTPNPFALKFILNTALKDEGKATFSSPIECDSLPLLRDVFAIAGVRQVHVFQNTLTVTHSGDLMDEELSTQVGGVLRTRLSVHDSSFGEAPKQPRARAVASDPAVQEIEEILDRTIRPGLQADGGDVEVVSLADNQLQIVYQGACGGCPSSMMGTLDAIQSILRNELGNDSLTVVPV